MSRSLYAETRGIDAIKIELVSKSNIELQLPN